MAFPIRCMAQRALRVSPSCVGNIGSIRCISGFKAQYHHMDVDPGDNVYTEKPPPVRTRIVDSQGRAYGTGKKKTAIARVWVSEGSGRFIVNQEPLHDKVKPYIRVEILKVLLLTNTSGLLDVHCTVHGGGFSAQGAAIAFGLAKALQAFDPVYRPILKKAGFLTRDTRRVERKKPGQEKARKKFAWVKR